MVRAPPPDRRPQHSLKKSLPPRKPVQTWQSLRSKNSPPSCESPAPCRNIPASRPHQRFPSSADDNAATRAHRLTSPLTSAPLGKAETLQNFHREPKSPASPLLLSYHRSVLQQFIQPRKKFHGQPCRIRRTERGGLLNRRPHHFAIQNVRLKLHEQLIGHHASVHAQACEHNL